MLSLGAVTGAPADQSGVDAKTFEHVRIKTTKEVNFTATPSEKYMLC